MEVFTCVCACVCVCVCVCVNVCVCTCLQRVHTYVCVCVCVCTCFQRVYTYVCVCAHVCLRRATRLHMHCWRRRCYALHTIGVGKNCVYTHTHTHIRCTDTLKEISLLDTFIGTPYARLQGTGGMKCASCHPACTPYTPILPILNIHRK